MPRPIYPREKELPGTHQTGSWVGPTTSLKDVEKRNIYAVLYFGIRRVDGDSPLYMLATIGLGL
jgi:hypothetical protein